MRRLLGLAWLLFVLGLLELGCAFWIEHFGDALDRTRRIVEADAHFGWGQRANLDTTFYGQPLTTNALGWRTGPLESVTGDVAVLLGPSSAFGWGVKAEETYGARLEDFFRTSGKPMRVINASEIGYSTQQGVILSARPEIAALHPKLLIVAYGVNDLDRHRFFFQSTDPDSVELYKPHGSLAVFHALSRSSLLAVLFKVANNLRAYFVQTPNFSAPSVRVPPSDFEKNLHAFAALGKRFHARVVFLGTPGNFPPLALLSAEAQAVQSLRFEEGLRHFKQGDLEAANRIFQDLIRLEPRRNEIYYYLSEIARLGKRRSEELAYADMAKLSEPFRVHRDVMTYNSLVKRVAAEENAVFVDLYALFPEADKAPLFVDPIHPSASGHERIAKAIAQALAK